MSTPRLLSLEQLIEKSRACLYMSQRHVTTQTGSRLIAQLIKEIETHPHMVKYFNKVWAEVRRGTK